MAQQREDIEDEGQQGQPEQEGSQQPDDNQPDVEIKEENGKTEVRMSGETRRERRERERREERQRELDARLNPLQEQLASTQRMLQEALGRLQAPVVQQQPQQPQISDDKKRFREVVSKQERIIERLRTEGARMSISEREKLKEDYYDLEGEKVDIRADRIAQDRLAKFRPPEQPSPYVQQLQMEHPDVWANERARNYAAQVSMARIAELEAAGTPPAPSEVRKIHNEAFIKAAQVFLGRRPSLAPTSDGQRQRFAGTPSAAGGSRGGFSRQLTKEERELALSTKTSSETDDQAIARWTKAAVAAHLWD